MARKLNDWIESYLQYTDNSEPPRLYREWVAVSCVAAMLKRKCFLPWGPITFYPNLYVVLVGPSGKCRKGTAMSTGASFLKSAGVKMAAEAITREALIRELNESNANSIDVDSGQIDFHASLTIYSQELTVFLGYDNKQLISDLTDWYDCRERWTYRTKSMGTDEIIGVWVNLIGATTPEMVQTALPQDAVGGGLASRIIFVYEENKGKTVPFPFLSDEDLSLQSELQTDLERIGMLRGNFTITNEFLKRWGDWYIGQENNPPFQHNPNFQGYVQRRPNHVLKLCVVLSAASRDDKVITLEILERAIDLLGRTEVKMARTFAGYGAAEHAAVTSRIMNYIAARGTTTDKELMQAFYSDVKDLEGLNNILGTLVAIGFSKQQVSGRNGRIIVTHNPKYNKGEYTPGPKPEVQEHGELRHVSDEPE